MTSGMIVPTESVVIAKVANIKKINPLRNRVETLLLACWFTRMPFAADRSLERPLV